MPYHHLDLTGSAAQTELAERLGALRTEFELPDDFPAEVLAEAQTSSAAVVNNLPEADRTELELVTIDPAGSTDLDQAVHIQAGAEDHPDGYTVRYAIADVPAFITPGGALDAETMQRGQTVYLPDARVPLHPEVISEDAGSLLPEQNRGAYLWTFALDAAGAVVATDLERATVRSRAQLTYVWAQEMIDGGSPAEAPQLSEEALTTLRLLREVGLLRIEQEAARGGASLNLPDQEVAATEEGYRLVAAPPLPVEDWNAQISLMTGMAAAHIMLEGTVGILRTMPDADESSEARFRARTVALGTPWPKDVPYGQYLRGLDTSDPRQLAIMHAATSLFRGAGYTSFDGELPEVTTQAAIAAPYTHTTAPLRRLVDRFVLEVCLTLVEGREVPAELRQRLAELPEAMKSSGQVASRVENAALDLIEAAELTGREGQQFPAIVVSAPTPAQVEKAKEEGRLPYGEIQLGEPPVLARYEGFAEAGDSVTAELVSADMESRTVLFHLVDTAATAQAGPDDEPTPAAEN